MTGGELGSFASLAQGLLESLDLKPGWMVFHGGDVSLDFFKITPAARAGQGKLFFLIQGAREAEAT